MIAPDSVTPPDLEDILAALETGGFWTGFAKLPREDPGALLRSLMVQLGAPYVPDGCTPEDPIIRTAPSRRKTAAPFDRPEAIGWHGDFASHDDRPKISLVHVARADPGDPNAGAWRLASSEAVLEQMTRTGDGRGALAVLEREALPFSYSDFQPPRWFKVIAETGDGTRGIRFFAPSIARGFHHLGQDTPASVAEALGQLERAADAVQVVVPTTPGSLLVIDNWRALHDRTPQTATRKNGRQALLGFVSADA